MIIASKRISLENFKSYGTVVTTSETEPTFEAINYKFWSDIAHYQIDGSTEMGICTVYRQPVNEITELERHQKTPEILIPIDDSFVLPLLLEGRGDRGVEAFLVDPGEAVVVNTGVWHGACIPLRKKECSYFVIFRKNTPLDDCEQKGILPVLIES